MRNVIFAGVACCALAACATGGQTPDQAFSAAVAKEGYTEVKLGAFAPNGCGGDLDFAKRFTARTATGQDVHGVVCATGRGPAVKVAA
jgi:hypothetical protein